MSKRALELADPASGRVDVLFVAGEHSGDQHAAVIASELAAAQPDWRMAACGGPALQRAGVQLLHDLTRDSVVGLVEVLRHYGDFKRLFEALLEWIRRHQPRVVVLVDYPGFNLRLAEAMRKRGLSRKGGGHVAIYQYVSPQIWAWKAGRRFKMAEILDELGVIFPFEVDSYADTHLPVRFVGHPFVQASYRNPLVFDPDGPILLLPGSRRQAVGRIFPLLLDGVAAYLKRGHQRRCVCLYPEAGIRLILEEEIGRRGRGSDWVTLRPAEQGTTAAAVLTSSGTMSLNCALAGLPGAIVYRAHPLTAWLGRRLIRIPWLGIANLVLGREVYPECLQEAARPGLLADHLEAALGDPGCRDLFAEAAGELREKLGGAVESTAAGRIAALGGQA